MDQTAWNAYGYSGGREEYVLSSAEFRYDEFALTDRGTVTGQAPGYAASYTNRGNLTTVNRYLAGEDRFLETHHHYDTLGNVVKTVDPLDRETTLGYSASTHYAYPTSATNPIGHTISTSYDLETGLVQSVTDANSNTTAFTYDAYNRLIGKDHPDGGKETWDYQDGWNNGGQLRGRTFHRRWLSLSPSLYSTTITYVDGLGRNLLTQAVTPSGPHIYVSRQYALCGCTGRTSRVSMPYYSGDPVYWTETKYDALGRVTKVIPPGGTSQQNFVEYRYSFTSEGQSQPRKRVVAAFDAKGLGRVWRYDSAGTPLESGENANYSTLDAQYWTTIQFYPRHNTYTVKQVQWQGQTLNLNFPAATRTLIQQGVQDRRFEYDFLGRLVQEMHPEHRSVAGVQKYVSYQYDDAGRVIQRTDPRGVVTTTAYDALDRPLTLAYSDNTPSVTHTYDQGSYGIGRLHSVSNAWAISSFAYDTMGRVIQEDKTVGGVAFSRSFTFNAAGLPLSETLPNGKTVLHDYDRMGRVSAVTSDWVDAGHPAVLAGGPEYSAAGALTSIGYGNGTASARTYTSSGLLKTLQHGTGSDPGKFVDFEYDYDEGWANNGRIMRIDDHNDPSKSQTFGYDKLHRLVSAETDGSHWGLQWSYDRYGNRLSQSATKGVPPTHSAAVDAWSNRITSWSYDEAGNVLDDGLHAYAYDANNRVTSMDSGAAEYFYDGQGNRVMKTVGGVTTYYFWGHERTSTGWKKFHVFLKGEKLAEYSGGATRFFHANHLGTPVARTDISGAQNGSWTHYPFGEQWESTGLSGDQHKYTGHLQDSESGNAYAGARYYAGGPGRWSSVDPVAGDLLNPQSLNRYSYVLNDAVNLADSTGRFFELVNCRSFDFLPGSSSPFEFCQVVFLPGPTLPTINLPLDLFFADEIRSYIARIAELLSTPIATERISDDCKALFGQFIEAVRRDPSLIEDVSVNLSGGISFTASANLRTLEIAYGLIDLIRVNRGIIATIVTRISDAFAVTFFNLIFIRPENATNTLPNVALLFHEFYHVGQFFASPLALFRLVGEQIFQDSRGPLEREAYAAQVAFESWVRDNLLNSNRPCTPLLE